MAAKKIITVFGATGSQGGSVARIFLQDPKLTADWTVRAVTRDTTKDNAKKLQSQGAEVVAADMDDKPSLVSAMTKADAVFAVTNYWADMNAEHELQQGKNLVDAAKEAGVKHFIFSSLYNIKKLSNGKLPNVYHFDSKAETEEYARGTGIPATYFMPGVYMSNFAGGVMRPTPPDNHWAISLPIPATAPIPLFDPESDTGKFVKAIVLKRDQLLGKRILGTTPYTTGNEIIETFKKVFPVAGKTASYNVLTSEQFKGNLINFAKMPDFAAQELLENFLLLDQFGYYGGANLDESLAILEDKPTTWEEFLKTAPATKDLE